MKLVFDPTCLEYARPGHPEAPRRVQLAYAYLKDRYRTIVPGPIDETDLLLVHSHRLVESVQNGEFRDWDTPNLPGIYQHALQSVAGAVTAMRRALEGEAAFSLMRPPGHHAGPDYLAGFCYFNNIAVATAKALKQVGRVAIVDFDCHHGNGTQDIFLGRKGVLYLSLHQSPFYPGTGLRSEQNCINFPMGSGTDDDMWRRAFEEGMAAVEQFEPDLLAVSAGFDGYKHDPFAIFQLSRELFTEVGQRIGSLGKPTFSVLEGGYSDALGSCAEAYIEGLTGTIGR